MRLSCFWLQRGVPCCCRSSSLNIPSQPLCRRSAAGPTVAADGALAFTQMPAEDMALVHQQIAAAIAHAPLVVPPDQLQHVGRIMGWVLVSPG